jgi:hypothetical protein
MTNSTDKPDENGAPEQRPETAREVYERCLAVNPRFREVKGDLGYVIGGQRPVQRVANKDQPS